MPTSLGAYTLMTSCVTDNPTSAPTTSRPTPAPTVDPTPAPTTLVGSPCASHTQCRRQGGATTQEAFYCARSPGARQIRQSHTSEGDLTCGSNFTGDTTGAAHNVGSSSGEHYYRLTVAYTTEYTFSTCEGSSYDTRLRLYSGDHLEASSVELANVDDACGLQSLITRSLEPGAYTLVVEGFSGNEGTATSTVPLTACFTCLMSCTHSHSEG